MTQHPIPNSKTRSRTSDEPNGDYLAQNGFYSQDEYDAIASEDTEWEDEVELPTRSDDKKPSEQSSTAGDSSGMRSTPRRRRRVAHPARSSRKQTPLSPATRPSPSGRSNTNVRLGISTELVVNETLNGAIFTTRYALDVLHTAIHLLRKPLSVLLFLWLLGFIMGQVSHTLGTVFAPLCVIPGISSSRMCRFLDPSPAGKQAPRWADYPKLVDVQSKAFGQVMEEVIGGSTLSLEIKKAEMATTDLIALVRISDLKARDTLASSLTEFIADAKKVGRGLHRLTAKVGGAVDNIMAVNDYALQSIESAREAQPPFWSLSSLVPWKSSTKNIDMIVGKTFEEAMDVLSNSMERLILEAEMNYQNLVALEERLATLHETIAREDSSLALAKTELLADLWTKLGGNRKTLRNFESHLELLRGLGTYRKEALLHVVAALQALQAMSEDMEDMRERVASPNLLGPTIPVEVHMKSIRAGLERLRDGRVKAKRLQEEALRRMLSIDENGSDEDA